MTEEKKPLDEVYPRVNFRLSENQQAHIAEREGTAPLLAKQAFEAMCVLLPKSLPSFREDEALFICHALNGVRLDIQKVHRLWVDISEALDESPQDTFDGPALVSRIKKLAPFECYALADAVRRYWQGGYHKHAEESLKRLHEVGLVKHEQETTISC